MTDVFISYSRKDKAFVSVLHEALTQSRYDAWVDWEDIPLTADWWAEIQSGIEASDTFIFVISPDSVESQVCGQEIDHAALHHKRLVPIVRRDGFDANQVHPAIGKHNWLFFRAEDTFDQAFQSLITALNTDLDYVKAHTRLLVRACEWQKVDRMEDYLLRGNDLDAAADWLAASSGKDPAPTALQQDYINASRKAEMARQQATKRRLQVFSAAVGTLALAALGLATFAWQKRQEAIAQRELAYTQTKVAFAQQLALEADDTASRQLFGLQTFQRLNRETHLSFGLAALPDDMAEMVRSLQPKQLVLSPSGQFLAVLTGDDALRVWNAANQQPVLQTDPGTAIVDVGFSPDEALLATATQEGRIRLWQVNAVRYTPLPVVPAHDQPLTDTRFSPDGRYLITAAQDGTASIWDLTQTAQFSTGQRSALVKTVKHGATIHSLDVSADSQHLITASEDTTLRVWSIHGTPLFCIPHTGAVQLARLTTANDLNRNVLAEAPAEADHTYLGSVSGNRLVRIWLWQDLLRDPAAVVSDLNQC